MGLDVDLLAISANGLHDESHHDSVVKELKSSYGLKLESVSKAVDLSGSLLNSWVSQPLELHPVTSNRGSRRSNSHFHRVAVVGAGLDAGAEATAAWDAFNRLFSLLAILPMQGIRCHSVAAPLFGLHPTSNEEMRDYSRLLELCRQGFRHLPELHRLILFDRDDAVMRPLGQTIDRAIHRQDPHHTLIERPGDLASWTTCVGCSVGSWTTKASNRYESHLTSANFCAYWKARSSRQFHSACTHGDRWNAWSAIICEAKVIMN